MENVIQWVVQNWPVLMAVVYGLVNLANAIVKLTPTEKDDTVVAKIMSWMDRLSILTNKDAAGTVKLPLTRSQTNGE